MKRILFVTFAALLSAGAASAQLIVNGSFELPDISTSPGYQTFLTGSIVGSGWEVQQNDVDVVDHYGGWNASHGDQFLDLNGFTAGSIFQDVTGLVGGQTYYLSFDYANNPLGNNGGESAIVQVTGGGTLVNDQIFHGSSTTADLNWSTAQYSFVAPLSGQVRVIFSSTSYVNDASGGVVLDNVSLIPEPATYAALFGVAALGVVLVRRRYAKR